MEAAWISEYKRETDRERRKAIRGRGEAEQGEGASEELALRKKLWEARYDERNGQKLDHFVRGWIELQALKRRILLPGEKKRIRKEIENIKACWQFPLCAEYGEIGAAALADELFNLTLFYMEICERDKMYNAVLLGLGHISDERRVDKIAGEIADMTVKIPERVDAAEELEPFIRSAREAFCYRYPSEAAALEARISDLK